MDSCVYVPLQKKENENEKEEEEWTELLNIFNIALLSEI